MASIEPISNITNLKFYIYGNNQVLNNSVFDPHSKGLYSGDIYENKLPKEGGLIDRRMGITNNAYICSTCNLTSTYCPGHFGHIQFKVPMFHIEFLPYLRNILNCVCHKCASLRCNDERKKELKRNLKIKSREQMYELTKRYCSNIKKCSNCESELFIFSINANKSEAKLCFIADKKSSDHKSFIEYDQNNIYNILAKISDEDAELLGFNPAINRPTDLMLYSFPVPPVTIRPSVRIEGNNKQSEDDATRALAFIFKQNEGLTQALATGKEFERDNYIISLQQAVASYVDNNSQYAPMMELKKKPIKSIVDRIKTKEGRIQNNLMGKRVNYCGRTVLTGDASLNINEVGVPVHMAKILTVSEYVTPENINRLKIAVKNGKNKYPGANYIKHKRSDYKVTLDLEYVKDAVNIEIGDIVERHLIDGDIVLFNRQPSLHKYSIMAHYVKVINNSKYASLRLNVGTTTPYNADYDGDEMNIFIPRSEQSRIELEQLAAIHKLLVNEQSSTMTVGCKLDNVCGPYLMSVTEKKFNKSDVMNMLAVCEPPIDKVEEFKNFNKNEYSGKEILSFIIPKNINVNDSKVKIKNGEIIDGFLGKQTLSSGQSNSLIRLILDLYNSEEARKFFDNIQRLSNKYLEYRGFTSSIDDITYTQELEDKAQELIKSCIGKINIELSETENDPTINTYESLDSTITSFEDNIRDVIGQMIINNFHKGNALDIFMKSGSASKVTATNICKACRLVGQNLQRNTNTRFVKKDMRRTLPYFNRDLDTAYERGFTSTGFLQGIEYPQFVFDAIASRESLIIERIKTADNGYFEKKIVKSLEDSKIQNDRTVRNTTNKVIQFTYSETGLSADKQYKHFISFLVKDDKEIKEMGKNNKKYVDKVIKMKKEILKSRVDVKFEILDLNSMFSFYSCINENKIKSMMIESKNPIKIKTLLSKIKEFDKNLNVILNGKIKKFNIRYQDNKLSKLITSAILYDIFNPKSIIDDYKVGEETIDKIINEMIRDSKLNLASLGKSVGVIAAQSISESMTQASLRAHHAIGQKSAVTGGFDRLKEIISMTKSMKTQSMTIRFKDEYATNTKYIKQIESLLSQINIDQLRTTIKIYYDPNKEFETIDNIKNTFIKSRGKCNWLIRINLNKETLLEKNIIIENILAQITDSLQNKTRDKINKATYDSIIDFECKASDDYVDNPVIHVRMNLINFNMNTLQTLSDNIIANIKINGIKDIIDCEMNDETTKIFKYVYQDDQIVKKEENVIFTRGINLDDIRLIKGVDNERILINDLNMIYELYGIEALRYAIINEFMKETGGNIKYNHISLLVDYMTHKGYPISIDRSGLSKAGGSLCGIVAFEESVNALINASLFEKEDNIQGVSSRLMTGRAIKAGTGFNDVILDTEMLLRSENDFNFKENNNSTFDEFIDNVVDNDNMIIPDD